MMMLLWLWQSMVFNVCLSTELHVQQTNRWLENKSLKVRYVLLFPSFFFDQIDPLIM